MKEQYLITTKAEMDERGWAELDFVIISGDAYVDHPSFAPTVIGRLLESYGYRVGIIAQPDWNDVNAFKVLGKPRLASLVTAGNLDSMLNKFTAAKKHRRDDGYSPGGESGRRPDRATVVYANRMREAFKGVPVVIGGIEASLRRFAHYDYWSDTVRRSILMDSKADVLIYGMGEKQIREIAEALDKDQLQKRLPAIKGICYVANTVPENAIECPSYEAISADKEIFAKAFKMQFDEQDPYYGKTVAQGHGNRYIVQNSPALPLTQEEMDHVYSLPYTRKWHPMYDAAGGVPALAEVQFSITSHRGCFGSCSFCAITSHQGRIIQNRSHQSILDEAHRMTTMDGFKGYIHDVGGPTANFRHVACDKQLKVGACKGKTCAAPKACPQLNTNHDDYVSILRKVRNVKGVKKVFVRSGLRYDYVLDDNNKDFVRELCEHHVSGQLKVAPEHVSEHVTTIMGKANKSYFLKFKSWFDEANRKLGKQQFLVPYFMSSHPGCTLEDAIELAEFLRDQNMTPEQVQDFIPTPGSLSTAMYYTGINPLTGEPVYVAKKGRDKAMQRALMQYKREDNYELVKEALIKANRRDLIGFGPLCLIPPRCIKRNAPKSDRTRISVKGGVKATGRGKGSMQGEGRTNSGSKTGIGNRKNKGMKKGILVRYL
ncbi:YgiQ family radical SAM protein [Veillonella sp. oral taxon 780]|uniref:YgiQ family radical SAM protein n=1 Tax=Veillonella sp. oral taxon 780 TaxID=671229 RepID=UPI00021A2A0F|nr:YgiQ family radical SAM protein [Veillonella sp. oral taxon 780]EGS39880.1 radical SAM protein YgiQ [Veillonella sp. oral taxon 780 str. F0422]